MRKRERERERQTDRQTGRQTDRQTGRQRQTDRQKGGGGEGDHIDRQVETKIRKRWNAPRLLLRSIAWATVVVAIAILA